MISKNPWLHIPVEDYEGHMSHEKVGQLQALNGIFKSALHLLQPKRICVLGCTAGNGFEHIDSGKTERIVGIDFNSEYLNALEKRFSSKFSNLELICNDIKNLKFPAGSFDMIHAALIFEYVDYKNVLDKISGWLEPDGKLSIVLQLPNEESNPVSDSPFKSLKKLAPIVNLVDVSSFCLSAKKSGLKKISGYELDLKTGKKFFVGIFKKSKEI